VLPRGFKLWPCGLCDRIICCVCIYCGGIHWFHLRARSKGSNFLLRPEVTTRLYVALTQNTRIQRETIKCLLYSWNFIVTFLAYLISNSLSLSLSLSLCIYIYIFPLFFVGGLPLQRRHGERDNYTKVERLVGGIMFCAYNEILNLSPLLMSVAILLKFHRVS
jgi:hypothetical protein